MTNTRNTPIEALEAYYPLRVTRYSLRSRSGGAGKRRGGDGVIRELELLADAQVSVLSERRRTRPYGLDGGQPGQAGENRLVTGSRSRPLSAKTTFYGRRGERLRLATPGGGGWGQPRLRRR